MSLAAEFAGRSWGVRATVLVPVAGLVFVIAYGVFGVGRDTTPRIHSLRNPNACVECHVSVDSQETRADEPGLCRRCHEEVGERCETACGRCHDPHGKTGDRWLLRPLR